MDSRERDMLFDNWWNREKVKWSFKVQEHEILAKSAWDACFRITNQSNRSIMQCSSCYYEPMDAWLECPKCGHKERLSPDAATKEK